MTPNTLMLRPLFITRIAMFACVLTFLVLLAAETPALSADQADSRPFATPFDVVSFALFVGVLLWMSWRNWRVGVHLTESEITVKGFFRDRTVPRTAVLDVAMGQLVWERADGEIQVTPITAFLTPPTGLAGVVVRHNEKCLSLLRGEFPGISNAEPGLGGWDGRLKAEEDRHFDPPTYQRPRQGDEPPKHAGAKRSRLDALPMMAQLAGSFLLTTFAVWHLAKSLGGVAGVSDAPGTSVPDPYSQENFFGAILPYLLLAALGLVSTVRLLHFTLRRRPNPNSGSSSGASNDTSDPEPS